MAFAHMFPADYRAHGYAEARRVWRRLEGTSDWRRLHDLARLLVSVREGALAEAADAGYDAADANPIAVRRAILALIDQPPAKEG